MHRLAKNYGGGKSGGRFCTIQHRYPGSADFRQKYHGFSMYMPRFVDTTLRSDIFGKSIYCTHPPGHTQTPLLALQADRLEPDMPLQLALAGSKCPRL